MKSGHLIDCNGRTLEDGDIVRKWWGTSFHDTNKKYEFRFHKIYWSADDFRWYITGCHNLIYGKELKKYDSLPKGVKLGEAVNEDNIPHRLIPMTEREKQYAKAMMESEPFKQFLKDIEQLCEELG